MKTVFWIGNEIVLSFSALLIWLSSANAGDLTWIRYNATKQISGATKTAGAAVIGCVLPSVPLGNLKQAACDIKRPPRKADILHCTGGGEITMSEAEYGQLWAAGKGVAYQSWNNVARTVTVAAMVEGESEACWSQLQAFISLAWPGSTVEKFSRFVLARNPANAGRIDAEGWEALTGTVSEWLAAGGGREGGPEPMGVVTEE